ncbi:MAG: molybdenum cofactor guanylyltransferase [Bacteroidetes bacterium]|nr:molybdenum cofactor guanylyltransferase [Bacteroidota bacterium]
MDKSEIGIILLAGGKSSRMGQNKVWMPFRGKPLVRHVLDVLLPLACPILIVGSDPALDGLGCPRAPDEIAEKGPMGGLYTGLKHSEKAHNLLIACDMPFVQVESVESLMRAHASEIWVTLAAHNGQAEPLLSIYQKAVLPGLERSLDAQRLGLQCFIQSLGEKVCTLELPDSNFTNLNTPDDLIRWI